tara:strand:+ start:136 stop:342 length:207 start_codon:yes stop_codon:yes gene_type:complete
MSKRIAQVYDGFLSYEKSKSNVPTTASPLSLGGRAKSTMAKSSTRKNKLSELDRVAEIISAVREYRMS